MVGWVLRRVRPSLMEDDPFAILWSIWKERNDRIFRSSSFSTVGLTSEVAFGIAKWALIRKEFSKLTFDDILLNWGACMVCGPSKVKRSTPWYPPPKGVLKFNVDGALSGKPGLRVYFTIARARCCLLLRSTSTLVSEQS